MTISTTRPGAVLASVLTVVMLSVGGIATAGEPPSAQAPGEAAPAWTEPDLPIARAITVTGKIEATEESFLGRAKSVQIVSPEAGTFLIEDAGMGRELKQHVGAQVTLVAERKTVEGKRVLSVEQYKLHES